MSLLNNVQIVLVRAENPVNIGQTARAMKNFGLSRLTLVHCVPHRVESAYTPGWKAKDVLDDAAVGASLEVALEGSVFTVGFTTRSGKRRGQFKTVTAVLPKIMAMLRSGTVSLLFGNERNGLSNDEIKQCHEMVTIPTSARYAALNLSHAVAVVGFLLFRQASEISSSQKTKFERYHTTPEEFEQLMNDFCDVLVRLGYRAGPNQGHLNSAMAHIRRHFKRGELDKRELHLFSALLSRIRRRIGASEA